MKGDDEGGVLPGRLAKLARRMRITSRFIHGSVKFLRAVLLDGKEEVSKIEIERPLKKSSVIVLTGRVLVVLLELQFLADESLKKKLSFRSASSVNVKALVNITVSSTANFLCSMPREFDTWAYFTSLKTEDPGDHREDEARKTYMGC